MNRQPTPFPTYILLPKMRAAVEEAIRQIQAPDGMVVSSALAVAALAIQAKYDVRRYGDLISPTSLFLVTIAESGDRKTTVDNVFFKPVRDFEDRYNQGLVQPGDDGEALLAGEKGEQTPPLRLLYSDLSPSALLDSLDKQTRSMGLVEDEGAQFLKGGMGSVPELLSKLWSGSDLPKDRKHESIRIRSPRGTLNLMLQPGVMAKYMQTKGDEARCIGLFARWLVSFPQSMQGQRFLYGAPPASTPAIEQYQARMTELLEEQIPYMLPSSTPKERIVMDFEPAAEERWRNLFNSIERNIQPGGLFAQAGDHASKLGEEAARVGAILHKVEGYPGTTISLKTLESAIQIIQWYSYEFMRLLTPLTEDEHQERGAALLDDWLLMLVRRVGWTSQGWMVNGCIERNLLLQYGPNSLRKKDLLQRALEYLQSTGRLQIQSWPSPNGKKAKWCVCLNPEYYLKQIAGIPASVFFPSLNANFSVWDVKYFSTF
jgi:hypothetical protein